MAAVKNESKGLSQQKGPIQQDSITVAINHVSLKEDSDVLNNPNIVQVFVEYKFLGIDPAETETPFSLPKPKPNKNIQFNFSKTFHVDFEKNYQRRQYLASMLLPSDPDDGRIRFTLVSEPPEDEQDGDCEDIGFALVNVRDILRNRKDVIEEDIDILDVGDEKTVIGSMNLTVQCLIALDAVKKELNLPPVSLNPEQI